MKYLTLVHISPPANHVWPFFVVTLKFQRKKNMALQLLDFLELRFHVKDNKSRIAFYYKQHFESKGTLPYSLLPVDTLTHCRP